MNRTLLSRTAWVLYPSAARVLRLYLTRSPIRYGKPRLLDLWLRYMSWRRDHTFTAYSSQKIRFRLNTVDTVSSHIFLCGVWESGLTELMLALLHPGDSFIDVGANIGYHSMLAASLIGRNGRVVAIEPAPHIRENFEHNLALNPELAALHNITLLPYCASDQPGNAVLSAEPGGNSGETTLRALAEGAVTIPVETRTLDDMLAGLDLSRCPLVKMDIEGAEYLAVSGMEKTLARFSEISLMLEVDDRFLSDLGHSAEKLFHWFESRGYQAYTIVAPRANLTGAPLVLQCARKAPSSPENVLFTRHPERFAKWMDPA